jgi:dGTPase
MGKPFRHNEQSLRVVDELEKDGQGLNLTYEVRMGILGHTTGSRMPETLEGQIVRFADQIAYINHDIDDAMRAGILTNRDIPRPISYVLGDNHRDRINSLVTNLIRHSRETEILGMDEEVFSAMQDLRSFMFERVYKNPVAKGEESKARRILQQLYEYYIKHPTELPEDFQPQLSFEGMERVVCDYIAGMTDKYAMFKYEEIFIPAVWQVRG